MNARVVRTAVLGVLGFGLIAWALAGCSKGPSAEDRAFLKGCDEAAHAVLESLGISPAPQENFDKACVKILEASKAKK